MDEMPMDEMPMDEGKMGGGKMGGAPGGAPDKGPPPGGAPMSPDEIRTRVEQALPVPDEGYSVKKIGKVADATNDAMHKLLPKQDLPDVVVPPNPDKGDRWAGKLPVEVMVPALLLADMAVSLGGENGARYSVDPASLVNDGALDLLVATLRAMASDKKLARIVADEGDEDGPAAKEKPAAKAPDGPPKEAAAFM